MELKQLQELISAQAKEKSWGIKPNEINFAEKIALIHAEVSEALEAYRQNNLNKEKDSVEEELADTIIRILHLAGIYKLDLEKKVIEKIEKNKDRDWSKDQMYIDNSKRGE